MEKQINWGQYVGNIEKDQYEKRIDFLKKQGFDTTSIENTIKKSMESLAGNKGESFVIFGEPQSGKTEMMIALNAKLIDDGYDVIINLLTDSIDLLQQNYQRFLEANLSPSPKLFSELLIEKTPKIIAEKQCIIFSKKNARDLEKLRDVLRAVKKLIIIDDEADFASPNSKINSGDRTKINNLIHTILANRGKYIGVTATPARLDLNNTFENNTRLWVDFDPHPFYVGQDFFFPDDKVIRYRLNRFSIDKGDERKELRNAVFHFLCGVAEQHLSENQKNFSMLIHTSGKTDEHKADLGVVQDAMDILSNVQNVKFNSYVEKLKNIAENYNSDDPSEIVIFVLKNIKRNKIIEINSKNTNKDISIISDPKAIFSFGVGGNIISRGVTFNNLLSMYFTRSVKGKFSQDTYIQRARMFGTRDKYKEFFQLWIPDVLFLNWYKCFIFHKLAIQSAKLGGVPVWLSDYESTPTSSSSIDRSSVDIENGEMSFSIFNYNPSMEELIGNKKISYKEKINRLREMLPNSSFPDYIYNYLESEIHSEDDICFHKSSQFGTEKSGYPKNEIDNIRRQKGIFSGHEMERGDKPDARHHLKIFYNSNHNARLFYKVNGTSIKFIQNKK
jgi:hypothetical protein